MIGKGIYGLRNHYCLIRSSMWRLGPVPWLTPVNRSCEVTSLILLTFFTTFDWPLTLHILEHYPLWPSLRLVSCYIISLAILFQASTQVFINFKWISCWTMRWCRIHYWKCPNWSDIQLVMIHSMQLCPSTLRTKWCTLETRLLYNGSSY